MRYAIIDSDGDCIDRGYTDYHDAIRQAKHFILQDINLDADAYALKVWEMDKNNEYIRAVATITLTIDWEVATP